MSDTAETDIEKLLDFSDMADVRDKYLTFFCDAQLFAVSIAHVVQIVSIQKITPLPEAPDYAMGVINLRGSFISVIDTRRRLKKPDRDYDERTCIIIATIDEVSVGFIVDAVDEVLTIEADLVATPKNTSENTANVYVSGIASLGDKIILLLDIVKLFSESEIARLKQAASAVSL